MSNGDVFGCDKEFFNFNFDFNGSMCELFDLLAFEIPCAFECFNTFIKSFKDLPLNIIGEVCVFGQLGELGVELIVRGGQTVVDARGFSLAVFDLSVDKIGYLLVEFFPELFVVYIIVPLKSPNPLIEVQFDLLDFAFCLDGHAFHRLQL